MLDCEAALDALSIRDGRLLVAVSGGRDSCVLLDVLERLAPGRGLELAVGHVNHGLRGADAEADAAFVARRSAAAGHAFGVRSIDPKKAQAGHSSRERPTLEEAARSLRRAALLEIAAAEGARWIATAHHAGDQAETMLMRVLRGTGPEGLAGIHPVSGDGCWIRPLLRCEPGAIEKYAGARGVEWREDASNVSRAFTRNRLRHDWIPGLSQDFNPQLLRTLGQLAETLHEEGEWIEAIVEQASEGRVWQVGKNVEFALGGWSELPPALARRLVRRSLILAGLERDLSRAHVLRVLEFLCRGTTAGRPLRVELPRGRMLRRGDDRFVLEPA